MKSFRKLFIAIYTPLAIVLLLCFYVIYSSSNANISGELERDLINKWSIINAMGIDNNSDNIELYRQIANIERLTGIRITLIDKDGVILSDSAVPMDEQLYMQNHKEREEVRNALRMTPQISYRTSATIGKDTIYYAQITDSDTVLRIALDTSSIVAQRNKHKNETTTLLLFALIVYALVSAYFANKFARPIKALDNLSDQLTSKDNIEIAFPDFRDESINKITSTMYTTYKNIAVKQKDINYEREKLNTIFSAMKEGILLLDKNNEVIHINDNAMEYIGSDIKIGTNVLNDISEIDTILFFKDFIGDDSGNERRAKYRERIYDIYTKTIGKDTLVVLSEVTESVQYDAFKSELVGNITHEIKTPLALLLGTSETILNDPDMDVDTRNKFLESIFRNSHKLNNLINETFELHILESQKGSISVEIPADLNAIVDDLLMMIPNDGKTVTYNVSSDKIMVRAEHILSVISNLVTNALKYSDGKNIDVDVKHLDNKLIIKVSDEGPAIPESEQKRIFERFYTVSKSRTRKHSGTGLGLAIVKHIAKQYVGKVSVSVNVNGGNTFEVVLHEQ